MTIYKFYIAVEAASSHSLLVREGEEEREELHQQLGLQGDDNHPWVGLSHPKAGCRFFCLYKHCPCTEVLDPVSRQFKTEILSAAHTYAPVPRTQEQRTPWRWRRQGTAERSDIQHDAFRAKSQVRGSCCEEERTPQLIPAQDTRHERRGRRASPSYQIANEEKAAPDGQKGWSHRLRWCAKQN